MIKIKILFLVLKLKNCKSLNLLQFLDQNERLITNDGTNARFLLPGEIGMYPDVSRVYGRSINNNTTLQSPFYSPVLKQEFENYRYLLTYILTSDLSFPTWENDTLFYYTSQNLTFSLYPTRSNYFSESRLHVSSSHKISITPTSHVLLEDPLFFNFLTCDGNSQAKEDMLLHALPVPMWILVGCIYLLATVLLTILTRKLKPAPFAVTFLNSAELLLNFVLEQGDLDLRLNSGTTKSTSSVASLLVTLLLSWAMTVLLMDNVYKSYVTSDESVLVSATAKYETFQDLVQDNFSIVSPLLFKHDNFKNRTDESNMALTTFGETLSSLWKELNVSSGNNDLLKRKYSGLVERFLEYGGRNRGIYYDSYQSFYKFLENCNKTALVHLDKELGEYLQHFKDKNRFVTGKDKFPAPADAWFFENYNPVFAKKIYRRLSRLIQGGIYDLFKARYDLERKRENGGGDIKNNELKSYLRTQLVYSQQKLVGPLLVFFGTTGKLFAIAVVVFVLEVGVHNFMWVGKMRYPKQDKVKLFYLP